MKPADWMRMLDQLREALNQTAVEVARHEQTLASPLLTGDLSGARQVTWQRALERFTDRLQDGQSRADEAERLAREADRNLDEYEQEIAAFRRRVEEMRRRLADVPPGV